ncbi:MAG: AbrB/MazE/SpoVT family DNA-binding domain-containing protein [Saprospiraceae bacterium]
MEAKVVKIGNSKGIRLSKTILEKYEIGELVNIKMEEHCIIIEPVKKPRTNWSKSFKEMRKNGDDELLINDLFEEESSWE